MEHYTINKMGDITYPERCYSTKSNIGIPKNNLRSFYIRDKSEFISSEARDLINTIKASRLCPWQGSRFNFLDNTPGKLKES